MHDVARLAGVSHQTVSRVINGSTHVSDGARQRVEQAIAQLGYRPNTVARALATHRTTAFGVISVETAQYGPGRAVLAIAVAARAAGYSLRMATLPDPSRALMSEAVEQMAVDGVDGIAIVAPVLAAVEAAQSLRNRVPLVLVDAGTADSVGVDQEAGGRLATRHLLELGHGTVLHLRGPEGWVDADLRARGWLTELSAVRARVYPPIVGDWSAESGYRAGLQIAAAGDATAVFAANDQMACGLLRALLEQSVDVPGQVSVVGFDDMAESRYFHVPLTTVRQDFADIGRACIERLSALLEQNDDAECQPLIQPRLMVRASARPPMTSITRRR